MKARQHTDNTHKHDGQSLNKATPPATTKPMSMDKHGAHYGAYISVMAVRAATHLHESQGKGVPLEEKHADRGW